MKTFLISFTGRFDEATDKDAGKAIERASRQAAKSINGTGDSVELKSGRLVIESGGAHHNEGGSQSVDLLTPEPSVDVPVPTAPAPSMLKPATPKDEKTPPPSAKK